MRLALVPVWVWVLSGILFWGASVQAQTGRGGSGAPRATAAGSSFSRPALGQNFSNPPSLRRALPNHRVPGLGQPPHAGRPLGGSFREQGLHGFSTPLRRGTNFGNGDFGSRPIEWWRWVDSRRHIRFRDPHFRWRSRFFVIHVPGFFGTWGMAPYIPITPYVAPLTSYYIPGPAWTEQSRDYSAGPAPARERGRLAPFDPTPQEIVQRMLALGELTAHDVVYDLGAGDGRIAIAAAKHYGVRAVGIEIDPGLVTLARENVRREGLERLVEIREQDFMAADLSPATVVTLYLSHEGNLAVRPKLFRELRPGARVVSYTFDMAEWQPKIAESYRDAAGARHMIYLWQISDSLVFSDNRP